MENWIRHIREPRRLLLVWQAPDHSGSRDRWAIGAIERDLDSGAWILRYLQPGYEFASLNQGRSYDDMVHLGYQGFPGFKPKLVTHRVGVAEALLSRLPPRNRPDFNEYKEKFRLPADLAISDFALIGQTEAKLPSDGFSVVDPLDGSATECDALLEVAGYRHYVTDFGPPWGARLGDKVEIVAEPENPVDPGAVKVMLLGRQIGHVNRLQAPSFLVWLRSRSVEAVVERFNGKPGRPRAFIFVRIREKSAKLAA